MKTNITLLSLIGLFLISSCEEIDETRHRVSIKNRTTTELRVVYQTVEMSSSITSELGTDVTSSGIELGSIVEEGDQEWLSDDEIDEFVKVLLLIQNNDTVLSNPSGSRWTRLDGGVDTPGRSRGYLFEINESDL